MRISVTREDIERGVPGHACLCALARAIERQYGPATVAATHFKARGFRFRLPLYMQRFVLDFDSGLPVEPVEFEV